MHLEDTLAKEGERIFQLAKVTSESNEEHIGEHTPAQDLWPTPG